MDWKSALVTFAVIFFMEIGDKTQLMVMAMSSKSRSPGMILLGATAALCASSLLAVWVGGTLLKAVPIKLIRMATGIAFMAIGGMLLVKSMR